MTAMIPSKAITARLEYLRGEINAERISMSELAELADLIPYIEPGDVQLLEWAGVPEFPVEMAALVTDQGTAVDPGLCVYHDSGANRRIIEARRDDDVTATWADATGNDQIDCLVCREESDR